MMYAASSGPHPAGQGQSCRFDAGRISGTEAQCLAAPEPIAVRIGTGSSPGPTSPPAGCPHRCIAAAFRVGRIERHVGGAGSQDSENGGNRVGGALGEQIRPYCHGPMPRAQQPTADAVGARSELCIGELHAVADDRGSIGVALRRLIKSRVDCSWKCWHQWRFDRWFSHSSRKVQHRKNAAPNASRPSWFDSGAGQPSGRFCANCRLSHISCARAPAGFYLHCPAKFDEGPDKRVKCAPPSLE